MAKHHAPGLYFEWLDRRTSAQSLARADVAGFVGITRRGPMGRPIRVETWTQFTSAFGGHADVGFLSWAVEGFFANGGRRCWVVRAASPKASAARWTVRSATGAPALTLLAASPGTWAQQATVAVTRVNDKLFSLSVRLPDGSEETWRNLSIQPPYLRLADKSGKPVFRLTLRDPSWWSQPPTLKMSGPGTFWLSEPEISFTINPADLSARGASDRISIERLNASSAVEPFSPAELPFESQPRRFQIDSHFVGAVLNDPATGSRLVHVESFDGMPATSRFLSCSGGTDGLADMRADDFESGLNQLAEIEEIAVLAMPDIVAQAGRSTVSITRPSSCLDLHLEESQRPISEGSEKPPALALPEILRLQLAMVTQCEELRDRIAILDSPWPEASYEEAICWRQNFPSSFAACYYPWLLIPDPISSARLIRQLPPSGHVAGICARVERAVGVHKPPANETLEGVEDVTVSTNDFSHGLLNDAQVNTLRVYPGRDIRVAGARTTSSAKEWRFLNVRRLFIAIERSFRTNLQWIAFEPSSPSLRLQVDRVIRAMLEDLWQRGYLDGASRDEAYSVRCDETTSTRADLESARLVCEIGLLPPWPAEFVVFRIGITEGGFEMKVLAEAQVA